MIVNPTSDQNTELCRRIEASVLRVADVRGLRCIAHDGRFVLSGEVNTRDEAMMCGVVARLVPGAGAVINDIRVQS